MRTYIVDECSDSVAALQEVLDYMSGRGWKFVQAIWSPKRKIWRDGVDPDENAGYVVIFETENELDADRS